MPVEIRASGVVEYLRQGEDGSRWRTSFAPGDWDAAQQHLSAEEMELVRKAWTDKVVKKWAKEQPEVEVGAEMPAPTLAGQALEERIAALEALLAAGSQQPAAKKEQAMGISALQRQAFIASPNFANQVNGVVVSEALLKNTPDISADNRAILFNVIRDTDQFRFPATIVTDNGWALTYDGWAADPEGETANYAILTNVQKVFNLLTGYQPPQAGGLSVEGRSNADNEAENAAGQESGSETETEQPDGAGG